MTPESTTTLIKNLDRRTSRIEQILPTLATKDDLKAFATKDDLTRLAAELRAELASKQDLRDLETRLVAMIDDTRRHAIVLNEDVRGDIRILAEHLAELMNEVRRLSRDRPSQ